MSNRLFPVLLAILLLGSNAYGQGAPASALCPLPDPAPATDTGVGKVKLNSSDAQTLDRELRGIGPAKAKAIVEYRAANGPFQSVDELLEVKGIGPATLKKNCDKLDL